MLAGYPCSKTAWPAIRLLLSLERFTVPGDAVTSVFARYLFFRTQGVGMAPSSQAMPAARFTAWHFTTRHFATRVPWQNATAADHRVHSRLAQCAKKSANRARNRLPPGSQRAMASRHGTSSYLQAVSSLM